MGGFVKPSDAAIHLPRTLLLDIMRGGSINRTLICKRRAKNRERYKQRQERSSCQQFDDAQLEWELKSEMKRKGSGNKSSCSACNITPTVALKKSDPPTAEGKELHCGLFFVIM